MQSKRLEKSQLLMERVPILIMCMNLKKKIGDRIDTLK